MYGWFKKAKETKHYNVYFKILAVAEFIKSLTFRSISKLHFSIAQLQAQDGFLLSSEGPALTI